LIIYYFNSVKLPYYPLTDKLNYLHKVILQKYKLLKNIYLY